jgi:hypothetical protein
MPAESSIFAEIHRLLEKPGKATLKKDRDVLEYTLTSGYAHALALEAERRRLERRITALAGDLGPESRRSALELTALARSLARTEVRLERLRQLIAALKVRAGNARNTRNAA